MGEAIENNTRTMGAAKIVYILYLVGSLIGITCLIGAIMAYINKNEASDWLKSHYQYQIRTFWIGALYLLMGTLLSGNVIGWFIICYFIVWLVARSIKGMQYIDRETAHPNPTNWFF
ncbi:MULTISPECIES: membrane protein [unclassified Pseudoalteromonas]|uniref:DUF4870 family protein n=1 Tax=unclassified Pseudoalteromonas TaxID=194690 RepID=UPI0005A93996|nr:MULTISPECIES: membrane protein [unclassified Pseudoalteromonas]PAJ71743.1 hypothetical protein CJF42_25060 [Pseudoalteromonas sp. NBT06-2]